MKKLWQSVGALAYWLAWPVNWFVLNGSERSRLVMMDDGKLLVIKGWFGSNKWGLPGGGLESRETPVDALLREVEEELSLELKPKDVKLILSEPLKVHGYKVFLNYFVAKKPKNMKINLQWFEVSEFAWVPADDLNDSNAGKDVLRAVEAYRKL